MVHAVEADAIQQRHVLHTWETVAFVLLVQDPEWKIGSRRWLSRRRMSLRQELESEHFPRIVTGTPRLQFSSIKSYVMIW